VSTATCVDYQLENFSPQHLELQTAERHD